MHARDKDFDGYAVGEIIPAPSRTITEADLVNFAGVSGDYHPLHVDEEYAKASPFGGRIAHGMLTVAVVSGLDVRRGHCVGAQYGLSGRRGDCVSSRRCTRATRSASGSRSRGSGKRAAATAVS